MVVRLQRQLILVVDARVVDVDEPVGRAGEEMGWGGGVEGEGCYVVGVDFVVGGLWGGGGADVPGWSAYDRNARTVMF